MYRDEPINVVSIYKYLGNIVDNHLSLNENFNKVYKKASNRLRLLSRMKSYLTSDAGLKIYEMMIIPLVTYSSSIHLNYNQSQKQKLQSIDRRATNIIDNGNVTTSIENYANRERFLFVKKCLLKTFNNNTFNRYFEVQNHNHT